MDNKLEAIGNSAGLCFRERADAESGHLGCLKKILFIRRQALRIS